MSSVQLQKLVLGTAQLGLDYGINNQSGQPTREQAISILDFAYQQGITAFDTAYAYGDAEMIIGEFLNSRGLGDQAKVITKLKPEILTGFSGNPQALIEANLKESLSRLKRDYVDGYLIHAPASYVRDDKLVGILSDFKKSGLVKNIGVSIYEAEDAIYAAKVKEIDYIQIPYNIFDQRLNKTDFFTIAKRNGVKIFARSPFLQGLFLMPDDQIPLSLAKAKVYLKEMDQIIQRYGLTRKQAALLFSYNDDNIDYVVFGVDNAAQLDELISIIRQDSDTTECIRDLKERFMNFGIDRNLISPNLWKK